MLFKSLVYNLSLCTEAIYNKLYRQNKVVRLFNNIILGASKHWGMPNLNSIYNILTFMNTYYNFVIIYYPEKNFILYLQSLKQINNYQFQEMLKCDKYKYFRSNFK